MSDFTEDDNEDNNSFNNGVGSPQMQRFNYESNDSSNITSSMSDDDMMDRDVQRNVSALLHYII